MRTMTRQRPQARTHRRSLRRGPAPKGSAHTSGGGAKKGMMIAILPAVGGLVARKMKGRDRSAA